MGVLTTMNWSRTSVLDLLHDAEARANGTFDIVNLNQKSGSSFAVVVLYDKSSEINALVDQLQDIKQQKDYQDE